MKSYIEELDVLMYEGYKKIRDDVFAKLRIMTFFPAISCMVFIGHGTTYYYQYWTMLLTMINKDTGKNQFLLFKEIRLQQ